MLPIVNTDIKMTSKMRDSLTLFETYCAIKGIDRVDFNDVESFLIKNVNKDLANNFKEEYLYKA
jgi:hypothetical protein